MCVAKENGGLYIKANDEDDLVEAQEKTLDCPMTSQAPSLPQAAASGNRSGDRGSPLHGLHELSSQLAQPAVVELQLQFLVDAVEHISMDATLKAVRIGGIEWRGLLREDYIKRAPSTSCRPVRARVPLDESASLSPARGARRERAPRAPAMEWRAIPGA